MTFDKQTNGRRILVTTTALIECILELCLILTAGKVPKDSLMVQVNSLQYILQEAQLMLTNPRDAFKGQSK